MLLYSLLFSFCGPSRCSVVRFVFDFCLYSPCVWSLFSPPSPLLVNYGTHLSFFLIDVTLSNRPIDGFIAKVAVRLTCHVSTSEINHPASVSLAEEPPVWFSTQVLLRPCAQFCFCLLNHVTSLLHPEITRTRRLDSPLASRDASRLCFHRRAVTHFVLKP